MSYAIVDFFYMVIRMTTFSTLFHSFVSTSIRVKNFSSGYGLVLLRPLRLV